MRRFNATAIALSASLALAPVLHGAANAQSGPDVTFELRPHCVESDHAAADNTFGGEVPVIEGITTLTDTSALPCPEYAVRDPLSKQTDVLKVGDTLDMDLILHNPSGRPLNRFRAWIAYDSNTLEGKDIALSNAFPITTPGEADFSIADNYAKLSGTSETPVTGTTVVLARITMTVKAAPTIGAVLSFYDASGTATAHTGAFTKNGAVETNVAATIQGSLAVRVQGAGATASTPSANVSSSATVPTAAPASAAPPTSARPSSSTAATATSSSASSTPAAAAVFSKLQVQALRVTTEGSSVFLAWNPLPSAELNGYNLYYGSISGRYLQRRAVDKDGQTLTIRALPVGQTYYFAVRAVNAAGQESDFSQEVAIAVGNPATSTSPLSGALIEGGPNGNSPDTDGNVAGASGPGTWMALFALVAAVTGTMLAFRRQWTVVSTPQQ